MGKLKMREIKGILIGVMIAVLSCIAVVSGLSGLILAERIGEVGAEVGINTAIAISAMIGCITANKLTGKAFIGSVINMIMLLGMMVITGWMIDGNYSNAAGRIIALVIGGFLSCAVSLKTGKNKKFGNRRYR